MTTHDLLKAWSLGKRRRSNLISPSSIHNNAARVDITLHDSAMTTPHAPDIVVLIPVHCRRLPESQDSQSSDFQFCYSAHQRATDRPKVIKTTRSSSVDMLQPLDL